MKRWWRMPGMLLPALVLAASVYAADTGAGPAGQGATPPALKVEFQKGVPCTVRVLHDGKDAQPWLLEVTPPGGAKSALRLPLRGNGATMRVAAMRAAPFVAPDRQELFLAFRESRKDAPLWCCVVDFADGKARMLFDSDRLASGFSAAGFFEDWYRVSLVFPELFDEYMLFIRADARKHAYAQGGIYDAKTEKLTNARSVRGSHLTAAAPDEPDANGLFALRLVYAVTGVDALDKLGEYACRLRRRQDAWRLQGDTVFTPAEGVEHTRTKQGAVPVVDMHVTVTDRGLEKTLPPPLARVKKIQGKNELDALVAKYGVQLVGAFDAKAPDTWFFLPETTPLTFAVHAVENRGGETEAANILASYVVEKGQAFVHSGTHLARNKTTQSMEPQFVISVFRGPDGSRSFLFFMPENENDSYCPGLAPLENIRESLFLPKQ